MHFELWVNWTKKAEERLRGALGCKVVEIGPGREDDDEGDGVGAARYPENDEEDSEDHVDGMDSTDGLMDEQQSLETKKS